MTDNKNIKITPAHKSDMLVIEQLASTFDLDRENISNEQFLVAKRNEKIIGFGRLRKYPECTELATVGVIEEERKNGVGTLVIKELIQYGPPEIFVTCVIPDFFNKLGFQMVKQYPWVLQKKVDFCKSYNFNEDQIFVMKFTK
jgi:N-acetylglutamate synthase-like GNAT family acetyltransferase